MSLQSLLSTPEPKDPQDAEVAGMLTRNPKEFERVAHEWAVKYAGAPKKETGEGGGGSKPETAKQKQKRSKEEEAAERAAMYAHPNAVPEGADADIYRYGGYNEQMINRFVWMGFDLDRVVSAFDYVGIDPNDGEDYELEEAYIGDITARLLGEP